MHQLNPGSTAAQSNTGKQATQPNEKYQDDDGDSDSDSTEEDDSVYCKKIIFSLICSRMKHFFFQFFFHFFKKRR